ncbi:hypothetical protein HYPSUDRAFT_50984 [Hypholoma sublateritium FD-334 SS-4]|uniref:Uncharacterized protein n=1 Tax=Hypholoma sublateritium (strain FD-334 SS-4) TaxID=945553 RepID=A0A0D2QAX6_HYPSF|nr:hypothetical protein HYPSUDRAFT_50984 [Hypholoma sublateritium FD-334 SS-4]
MDTLSSPAISSVAIDAQVERVKSFSTDINAPLNGLTVALLGEVGTPEEFDELRQRMRSQDQKHREGLQEIQSVLDDLLQNQIMEAMREKVEEEIKSQIDELVREQVAQCLKEHIPPALQDEFAMSKRELEELNLRLHNSESRRANGKLRSEKPNDALATMLMSDGSVSAAYPKDLKGLFSLDADTISALIKEYELPEPVVAEAARDRSRNLNRLMHFCGVRYQLVD